MSVLSTILTFSHLIGLGLLFLTPLLII